MHNNGVLIVNLGTPATPDARGVQNYLREFLSDPRVIDIPSLARSILVQLILLTRPSKTAAAYQKIWTAQGSPLLTHSNNFITGLRTQLGSAVPIALGMRYGQLSIQSALDQLDNCKHIIVLLMFPQYASAATGSAIAKTLALIAAKWNIPTTSLIANFYNDKKVILKRMHTSLKNKLQMQTPICYSVITAYLLDI